MSLSRRSIAVLGGGAGGQILAGIAAQNGHEVRLYSGQAGSAEWRTFAADRVVDWSGTVTGRARLSMVSDRLDEVLDGVSVIAVSAPAERHGRYVEQVASRLRGAELVVFIPGNFAGLRLLHALGSGAGAGAGAAPMIAETNSLPFSARVSRPGSVTIYRHKHSLQVGAAVPESTVRAAELIAAAFSFQQGAVTWRAMSSLMEVALANVNAILHVPLMLFNAGPLARGTDQFRLIPDGLSPVVDHLIGRLDDERLAIARALGISVRPIVETFTAAGFDAGATITEVLGSVSIPESASGVFPDRRLTEEVPFALWPLIEIGEAVGVDCSALRATAQFADLLLDRPGPGFPSEVLRGAMG